jgi:single-stranded-DNA-specific exonuclease
VRTANRIWQLRPHDATAIDRLAQLLNVSPVVAHLLLNRGLDEPNAARQFLNAPLTGLHEPELLPGAVAAAERLHRAILDKRRLCVYGDYDVDGVTGTAILYQTLRLLGASVEFHVPHRLDDGYGLNVQALRDLAERGVAMVVTVDCGIASPAEAAEARRLGLELVITDHHEPKDTLPDAEVLVHPRLPGHAYPFGSLCGSGVAFKVAWTLCKRVSGSDKVPPNLRELLLDAVALAALGTVADVVPLKDENRIFVRHGLARLRSTPLPGLQALIRSAGLHDKEKLTAADIGFALAPRLNAVGRLGSARLAVELLTTPSASKAAELARFLEEQNKVRQTIERRISVEAKALVEELNLSSSPAFVLEQPGWHLGLIGIVAGRLADAFARPVLLLATRGNGDELVAQGSGRSVPGFRLHEALQACGDLLLSHGGHATAAGFKLERNKLPDFRERFCAVAARHFAAAPPAPTLEIDAEVPLSALTPGLAEALNRLDPYGSGNPQPLFLAGDLQIVGEPRRVGGGERHLSFRVRQQGCELKAIAFGMADFEEELLSDSGRCCLVFTPKLNEWQGRRSVDLEVRDFQPGPRAKLG